MFGGEKRSTAVVNKRSDRTQASHAGTLQQRYTDAGSTKNTDRSAKLAFTGSPPKKKGGPRARDDDHFRHRYILL